MKTLTTIALSIAMTAGAANGAAAQDRPVRAILGGGITCCGETLERVHFSDGSSDSIRSGGLVHVYGGAELRLGTVVSVQATYGYHVDERGARNGDLRFSRYPLELLAHVQVHPRVRIGGGARFIHRAKLDGRDALNNIRERFDSTTGAVAEVEWLLLPNFGIKVRGVVEEYENERTGATIDANHGGVYVNWYF